MDAHDGGTATSGRWKELRPKFDHNSHARIKRDELEILSSLTVLLDWLIATVTGVQVRHYFLSQRVT